MRLGRILVLGWLATLISCTGVPTEEPFAFQMDWTHEPEFVGFYAALEEGYFREAGLKVTLTEGPAGTDVPGIVASGRADAAQMGMTMYRSAAGHDPDFVAVMATLQSSSRVLMTLEDHPITSPKDLEGLRVGIKSASWAALVRKVMVEGGADPRSIIEVPVKADEVDRFYRKEVDVWTGFATSEPVAAELAGHPVSLLFADDFGAGGYDELIVVKRSSLVRDPSKYQRFIKALLKGWSWAVGHEEGVVRLLDQWQPQQSHQFHSLAWKALRPLVSTGREPIGWIATSRWPGGADFTTDLLGRP